MNDNKCVLQISKNNLIFQDLYTIKNYSDITKNAIIICDNAFGRFIDPVLKIILKTMEYKK